ncbi:TorA-specific chaperone [Sinobacterium caligoides]|uniref:Chaperone protein TorD n=1 Tax=Sinobacterium caligoides TaxID=933926 RepID=A0A3N2DY35_9GAMM|nr:molecular chaperone TorD [Sinobacterium caligoides]ROS04780.1 TorA-specific chaperone [Sinobacterium caligoides]
MSEDQQLNAARAMVYQWLSGLFARELTEDDLALYRSEEGQLFLQQLAGEPELKQAVESLSAALASIEGREATLGLAADFCGLFLVVGREAVSPYAGSYLESAQDERDAPTLFGETHQRVVEQLRASGLELQSDFPEPADHIAVLLSFMAQLCVEGEQVQQHQFLTECLGEWVTGFSERVAEADRGEFYSAVARLTRCWLLLEKEWLEGEGEAP